MFRTLLLAAALAGAPAMAGTPNAKQLSHSANEGVRKTTLSFAWKGGGGGKDDIRAKVLTSEIEADKDIKRKIQLLELHKAMAKAARKSAQAYPDVQLTATPSKQGVQLSATGPRSQNRKALNEAKAAMERRQASWMKEHEVFEIAPDSLSYDHARIAARRSEAVAPVAAALAEGTDSQREFVSRALRFSQSIPYQKGKRGQDSGFQRPLALLARNKGDCDGKSALFLSILRAEMPKVPLAMVYVPGHALVGVGIKPEKGDQTFRYQGKTYVLAEPVGPGAFPLGKAAPENKRAAKQGVIRVVPKR
jgi:hypothetical protein